MIIKSFTKFELLKYRKKYTCSRQCRDKLMNFASLRRVPTTPVLLTRSDLEPKVGQLLVFEVKVHCLPSLSNKDGRN